MSNTEIKVDKIAALDEHDEFHSQWAMELREDLGDPNVAVVRLSDDSTYALDRHDPQFTSWKRFLNEWEELDEPVFIEADSDTRMVKTVLAPLRRRVKLIGPRQDDGRVRVVLLTAPSDFFLNPTLLGEEKYERFYSLLETARENDGEVLVTSYPATQEIVDVREPGDEQEELKFVTEEELLSEPGTNTLFGELSLLALEDVIPFDMARDEFRDLASRIDYIPFDYPFDCCTARAHEMCRILRRHGVRPEKVWNYGRNFEDKENTLIVFTSAGRATWYYHVAPVVRVRFSNGETNRMVLDPAMFDRPVTVERWKDRQNDAGAVHQFSPDRFYYREPDGADPLFDENHRKTRTLLRAHVRDRDELQF
jgi:hypothetical protein